MNDFKGWLVEWANESKAFMRYGDAVAFALNLFRWGWTDVRIVDWTR